MNILNGYRPNVKTSKHITTNNYNDHLNKTDIYEIECPNAISVCGQAGKPGP